MADLIDRAAAIKALREQISRCPLSFYWGLDKAMGAVDRLPAVDAVEVVRCRDCVRRNDPSECPMCFLSEGDWDDYTNDDGYCERGERREENG